MLKSDTETDAGTDSSYSESDYDEDVQITLHEASIINTDNSSEWKNEHYIQHWIQVLDRDADQDNSPTVFSPVNLPGPVNCIPEDSLPHEYLLHMIEEDFVDLLVKETKILRDKKIEARKGTIPKSSRFHKWCHTNREELLAFLAVVVNMGLIRKSCLKD